MKKYDEKARAENALKELKATQETFESPEGQRVFCDGACVLNIASACGVFFGSNDARNQSISLPPPHTAPRAELWAAYHAAKSADAASSILTDSQFVVDSFLFNFPAYYAHQDLQRRVKELCLEKDLKFQKIKGHSHLFGNDEAHNLAHQALKAF